jgi:hypothetical protein
MPSLARASALCMAASTTGRSVVCLRRLNLGCRPRAARQLASPGCETRQSASWACACHLHNSKQRQACARVVSAWVRGADRCVGDNVTELQQTQPLGLRRTLGNNHQAHTSGPHTQGRALQHDVANGG